MRAGYRLLQVHRIHSSGAPLPSSPDRDILAMGASAQVWKLRLDIDWWNGLDFEDFTAGTSVTF
jgi:hypothetical protein